VRVLNDVIRAADEGKVTCLVLLDLSAAFDTVDHNILLDVLRRRFLVEEPALKWFYFYLNDWTQVITVDGKESATIPVACSVPQGSVLGPVQFISYSKDVVIVFNAHQRVSHLGSVTARHSSSGRQTNFAALNRGRHLYSAGQPSRWALAHISSILT